MSEKLLLFIDISLLFYLGILKVVKVPDKMIRIIPSIEKKSNDSLKKNIPKRDAHIS